MRAKTPLAAVAVDRNRPAAMTETAAHVEAVSVSKRFGGAGGLLALEDISLSIASGEFVSILGPSGCGKSTFLRCIAALEKPTSGTIRVGGQWVDRPPENLGMVFQRDVLLDWRTILDNLFLPIDVRHQSRTARSRPCACLPTRLEAPVLPLFISGALAVVASSSVDLANRALRICQGNVI